MLGVRLPPFPIIKGEAIKYELGLFTYPPLSDKGVFIKKFCFILYYYESISYKIGFAS